uniref:ATPase/GTPase, AAA15 family n=1 Tax=Candidatus Kentrum sp. TUN TaxID=2126343 RepID=A0A451A2D0_9GAMM|nr:MAG: ATPase/GTPase, AAA15 family [Candidatus Kentron sp. TUN]
MSFQRISIKDFRAIASLEIDNIKQVNLLTGRNNCGKTSVLEAIFLLVGMSSPQLAVSIQNFRGLTLTDNQDFSYLFNGLDFSKTPAMTGKLKSQERTLAIKAIYPMPMNILEQLPGRHEPTGNKPISGTITTKGAPDGLAFDFEVDGKSFHTEVKIEPGNQVNTQSAQNYSETLRVLLINSAVIMGGLHQRLDAVLVRKDSAGIINALREIEPNLQDIRLGTGEKIFVDIKDIERLVPIHIMGDGIIKILAILVAILETKDGVLLIDEIENGLHYTALVPLWKAIFKMARESNVQLFIATHSYECISAMTEVYRESGMGKDFISLFRIDRDADSQHRARQYQADTLLAGIEKAFEVR